MFRVARKIASRNLRRQFSTTAEKLPSKGISHGGHPNVLQHEGNVKKIWLKEPAAWPIIAITGVALSFAAYKIVFVDAMAPDTHFNKHERRTLDYVENARDPAKAIAWSESRFHTGLLGKYD
eukprot:snap_masked-scaffold_21-processed-gene-4.22-mRNA-1 protein AED:0.58 eAED:0.58 QI:0/-1/0/1/-1/1/1/0/121